MPSAIIPLGIGNVQAMSRPSDKLHPAKIGDVTASGTRHCCRACGCHAVTVSGAAVSRVEGF